MTNWKTYRLKDVTSILGDGLHGTPVYDENGDVFFINGNNLENGHINIKSNTKRVSTEEAAKYRKPLNDRTILVSINGTIGNVGKYNNENCILGKSACYFNVAEDFDYDFIYYVIANDIFKNTISRLATGTTIKNVSLETMRNYTFCAPDITTQRRISKILGAIDDKIENNRRINTNLELQAQALFDEWFITNTSRLGVFSKAYLTDIANYLNGLAMQRYRPLEGEIGIPVLKIKELGQGQCDSSSDLCSPSIEKKYIVRDGDIIFSWSGTLLVDIWCGGVCGLNQHLFKVTSDKYPQWFIYYWTKHHLAKFIRIAKDKAVTMGHIKRGDLEVSEVLIPDEKSFAEMDKMMSPIFKAIVVNRIENRRLATLRDTLLPKLMNGELKIGDSFVTL